MLMNSVLRNVPRNQSDSMLRRAAHSTSFMTAPMLGQCCMALLGGAEVVSRRGLRSSSLLPTQ